MSALHEMTASLWKIISLKHDSNIFFLPNNVLNSLNTNQGQIP